MENTEKKEKSPFDHMRDKICDILKEFDGLNLLLSSSLIDHFSEDDYIYFCGFLRCLQKDIADFEFQIRTLPVVSSDFEEK